MAKPIEDDDGDPFDDPPREGPSLRELRREAAERGDVAYFLDAIRTRPWSMFSIGEMLRHLMRAAEVRARSDPEGYSRELYATMVGFNSFLLLRTQIYLADRIAGRGELPCTPAMADLSADVVERLLPRLLETQRGMADILTAQAQTARLWGLARAKEAGRGRDAAPGPGRGRGERAPAAKSPRSGRKSAGAAGPGEVVAIPVRGKRHG